MVAKYNPSLLVVREPLQMLTAENSASVNMVEAKRCWPKVMAHLSTRLKY
jgi:hypothetical protein